MIRRAIPLAALLATCSLPSPRPDLPAPARGVLVLSLSGLSSAALSSESAPFLSALAGQSLNYLWAVAPAASTLATQASLVTGLQPAETGIDHILLRPDPRIETLAERFARFGFATGGFTEGGFVSRAWGFERGFDRFSDPSSSDPAATARTLERSLTFLDGLDADQRFLIFVHSAALAPPWIGDGSFAAVRRGAADLDSAGARRQQAAYEAALSRLDAELRDYFAELDRRGLLAETTIVVVGDHGEEFLEHGRLGHDQLYPEVTRVPLLLRHPGVAARRVDRLVRTTDLLPTLSLMAGLPVAEIMGEGSLEGSLPTPLRALLGPANTVAWAEAFGAVLQRSVRLDSTTSDGRRSLYQLVETRLEAERDGAWVNRRVAFDAEVPAAGSGDASAGLTLRLVSFAEERLVKVQVDGVARQDIVVPRRWRTVRLEMPPGRHRLELASASCAVPSERGMGSDPRCLSFKVQEPPLLRVELFELRSDPHAERDISASHPEVRERMWALLQAMPAEPVARPERLRRTPEIKAYLSSLGYLDWGE